MKKLPDPSPHLRFAVIATDVALMTVKDNTLMVRIAPVNRPTPLPQYEGPSRRTHRS